MKRVHVLVEGQTEETFVNQVLVPHVEPLRIHLTPILVTTKKTRSGAEFKGGVPGYPQVEKQLRSLLHDSSAVAVTTMLDFYGLPSDFPGWKAMTAGAECYQRVDSLEAAWRAEVSDSRFIPYLSLHEFEALLLVAPEALESVFPSTFFADKLRAISPVGRSPEKVNDGPGTHPSARIRELIPAFHKPVHGPLTVARIGLPALRKECPHFDQWVTVLEKLGTAGTLG